jgi:hypothetical protein
MMLGMVGGIVVWHGGEPFLADQTKRQELLDA